jgi:hypothetical protein
MFEDLRTNCAEPARRKGRRILGYDRSGSGIHSGPVRYHPEWSELDPEQESELRVRFQNGFRDEFETLHASHTISNSEKKSSIGMKKHFSASTISSELKGSVSGIPEIQYIARHARSRLRKVKSGDGDLKVIN